MIRSRLGLVLTLAWLVACGGRGSGPTALLPAAAPLGVSPKANAGVDLPEPPVVRATDGVAKLTLVAKDNPINGRETFFFRGHDDTMPTIDVAPGDTIDVTLVNHLPKRIPPAGGTSEMSGMAMPDGTGLQEDINLHYHGLGSSPRRPGDDVLTMIAQPGQTLHYVIHVPPNQEPGLYWYHPHVHGETNFQVGEEGISGALVVEGIVKHIPELAKMKQRLIVVRSQGVGDDVRSLGSNTAPCVTRDHFITTLNGVVRPVIPIAPGERQFFRVVNATGHKTLNLNVEGEKLQVVAIDGFPLDAYPGTPATMTVSSLVIPPAARAEFVVTGPASSHARFRTLCYNTGPNGDPDPEILLGYLAGGKRGAGGDFSKRPLTVAAPLPQNAYSGTLPPPSEKRLVIFSENDKPHFFINGRSFNINAPPMFVVHTGTVEEWHVVNVTEEIHDFHIHQLHFAALRINGVKVTHPHWADSAVLPHRYTIGKRTYPGSLDLLMDFRDPVIRGMFVFHCHILDHEDEGMMAKIEAI